MGALERILEEFNTYKGQFVLTQSHRLERFVGIGSDDMDYYYITYDGRKLTWNTCVGKLIKLKGKLDDKDYNEFVRLARINHWDQSDLYMPKEENRQAILDFNQSHKAESVKLTGDDKHLTEICWDIN